MRSTRNQRMRPEDQLSANALNLEESAPAVTQSWHIAQQARSRRQQPGVTATLDRRNVSLAHQEESDSDEWDPVTLATSWPRDPATVARVLNNWKRVINRLDLLLTHAARERMVRRWDETRFDANQGYAVPTPKVKPKPKAKRAQRREDLVYIGRALPPNTSRRTPFPTTPELCRSSDGTPHTQYLKATGGKRADGTLTYSWLCQNCGSRFERTDLQNATDGEGAVHAVQARAGPLQPRSAAQDLAAQAVQSSGMANHLEQYHAALRQVEALGVQQQLAAAQQVEQQRHVADVYDMASMDDRMNDGTGTYDQLTTTVFPDVDPNDQSL